MHAGGSYYAPESEAKHAYWHRYWKREIRKNTVKGALLRIPLVRPLNDRFGWFRVSETPDL